MPTPGLQCREDRIASDVGLVAASGELDIFTADQLRRALADMRGQNATEHLIIDLTGVTFIDSSGLGVLVGSQRLTEHPLHVVAPEGQVRRALQLSNLHKVFVVSGTRDEALRAMAPGRRAG
jgi:anti-anti-sigma factor